MPVVEKERNALEEKQGSLKGLSKHIKKGELPDIEIYNGFWYNSGTAFDKQLDKSRRMLFLIADGSPVHVLQETMHLLRWKKRKR